ncbi:MAG: M48 family metalloprotease [Thermodesulfobacteriota bacterium]
MTKQKAQGILLGFCLIAFLLWGVSCAKNPVTGKQELMLLSESDEIKLGQETDVQVVREHGIYEDPPLTAYLKGICQRLGKASHRPNLTYHFKILDASVVNAFAVPGGYVYFTRGILAMLNNEAELAGVMGHEIGHITARHSAKQYSRAQLAQIGLGMGSLLIDSSVLSGLAQLGVGMLFLRFSRDNEREADDLGVEYASRGGYDATAMANFFETLERMNPGADRSGLPGWFSTHPSPVNRVRAVRARALEWQKKLNQKDLKINQEAYLRRIDGLVYGDDPRQGYVADNIFYHTGLRFQFPVPSGWKLNNTHTQVQIWSENQDALIVFVVTSGTSPREAAQKFVAETKARVIQSEALRVNSLPSYRLHAQVQSQRGVYQLLSYFIEKEKHIFVFHGLTPRDRFQNYRPLFDHTMRQFKDLTDPKRIHVEPDRIRIRQVRTAGTLENEFRLLGIPNEKMKSLALLNGRDLNQMVPANSLIKVVEKGM